MLLPVGIANLEYEDKRGYAPQLIKRQVEDLPEFSVELAFNSDYEERVKGACRPYITMSTTSTAIGKDN